MTESKIKQPATYIEKRRVVTLSGSGTSLSFDGYYNKLAGLTFTATPNNSSLATLDISELGLSVKPRLVIPISCFPDAICWYDYDSSSAQTIVIGVRNYSGGAYTSILRITCLIGIE